MGFCHFTFLALFSLFASSQPTLAINQTDLQQAMSDMRSASYNGFVIMLQMLNTDPTSPFQDGQVTFLMPSDVELSNTIITTEHLREFLLSHSIPVILPLNNLRHLPTGTMFPSGFPNRTITLANHGRLNCFLNNAKIEKPNICTSSSIKCHGITNILRFEDVKVAASPQESPPVSSVGALVGAAPPSRY